VLIGQETIEVSQDKGRNRLRAFIHARIGTCSRYTRLNKTLVLLYDRVSTGVLGDGRSSANCDFVVFEQDVVSAPHASPRARPEPSPPRPPSPSPLPIPHPIPSHSRTRSVPTACRAQAQPESESGRRAGRQPDRERAPEAGNWP
jgi:hypothetical protein